MSVSTNEDLGYRDAIRQVQRALQRRLKALEEARRGTDPQVVREYTIRIEELEHMLNVIESLHR